MYCSRARKGKSRTTKITATRGASVCTSKPIILLGLIQQSNVNMRVLSELPGQVDHNMFSVIEQTRRSIKDEMRAKNRFRRRRRRRRRRKQEMTLANQEHIQDNSLSARLRVLPETARPELRVKKWSESFLESEICCRKRERGVNFMQSIIIFSLAQVTCCLVLAQQNQYQFNLSPMKVVEAFRPTEKSFPNNEPRGFQFVGTIKRPGKLRYQQTAR